MKQMTFVIGLAALALMSATLGAQGRATKDVMRQKLAHSQSMLEALATSDWAKLETQSKALEQLTNAPGWTVLTYPEYAKYSGAFVRAVRTLETTARDRDLEHAADRYSDLVRACVDCHRYLARARMAK